MRARLGCCLLIASQGVIAGEAPVIGRLFGPAIGSTTSPAVNRLRIDGAVTRSSGRNTIWINGHPETEAKVTRSSPHTKQEQLPAVRLEGAHQLRVGDTLDRENGRRLGLLPEDAIVRGRK